MRIVRYGVKYEGDLWFVGRSVINDDGAEVVEFYCAEGEGILGKNKGKVDW